MSKAIHLSEIPPEYKHMKVIGRGNTSIILEKDEESVVMLTRDAMKKDWLDWGIGIAKNYKVHDLVAKDRKFKDFSVYAIEMPKLFKLDDANRKLVNKELLFFNKAVKELGAHYIKKNIDKLMAHYEEKENTHSIVYKLMDFLINYHPEQWSWDVAKRQFAQDKNGEIVLIDPIVCQDLAKAMFQKAA